MISTKYVVLPHPISPIYSFIFTEADDKRRIYNVTESSVFI